MSREREEEGGEERGGGKEEEEERGGGGEEGEEVEENEERMVGEVEVRCVGPGMQGVCGGVCTSLLVFFSDAKTLCTFGCCLCGTFDVSMWSRWCRAAIVALVKLFTWCACLWNSA